MSFYVTLASHRRFPFVLGPHARAGTQANIVVKRAFVASSFSLVCMCIPLVLLFSIDVIGLVCFDTVTTATEWTAAITTPPTTTSARNGRIHFVGYLCCAAVSLNVTDARCLYFMSRVRYHELLSFLQAAGHDTNFEARSLSTLLMRYVASVCSPRNEKKNDLHAFGMEFMAKSTTVSQPRRRHLRRMQTTSAAHSGKWLCTIKTL